MHFSKTYAELLLSLPPELRDNAIQYRQLKKLINEVVSELSSLGLNPTILHDLLDPPETTNTKPSIKGKERGIYHDADEPLKNQSFPKVVYEFTGDSDRIEPRLRLWINIPKPVDPTVLKPPKLLHRESETSSDDLEADELEPLPDVANSGTDDMPTSLLWTLQRRAQLSPDDNPGSADMVFGSPSSIEEVMSPEIIKNAQEVVIPLVSDTAFFQLLSTALQSLSAHLLTVHSDFLNTLQDLSRSIAHTARPVSSITSFRPHSTISSDAASIRVPSTVFTGNKTDLYSWREIFQLYVEAEVFESVSEATRGERSVEESQQRLSSFVERVTQRGLGDERRLKMKQSRAALETFLELNMFILNVKKFQFANAEATRKILKKHAKRTALPLPPASYSSSVSTLPQLITDLAVIPKTSLPRILVQAIGETLLPIIPHLDDYACLICTSIAFKPIRLFCGHLFCVRCLVKMQKRGKGDCPMCRAPTVLTADRSNVDWALLNFMQDWFPLESKEKLKQNEREATEEELEEMGLDPNQRCIVM